MAASALVWALLPQAQAWAQNDPFNRGIGGAGLGQDPLASPGGGSARPSKGKGQSKAPPGTPELHAASGSGQTTLPEGSEPSLPADPLALSDELLAQLGTDTVDNNAERGRSGFAERDFYGLYYQEKSGSYQLRTAFPLWFERQQPSLADPAVPDRASLWGGLYYNRRSAERADDIVFPVFWNLRDAESRTTLVGPFLNRRGQGKSDDWLAPLYFFGTRPDGGYAVIPPLLTYMSQDAEGGLNLFGPGFCSWKKGDGCFSSETTERDLGVAPFYFAGRDDTSNYRLIPPLLHYHGADLDAETELDVWGPYYREHGPDADSLHLMPLYWSSWGKDRRSTTLLPFFHYSWDKSAELFINPFYLSRRGEAGDTTFATWGYARHRGRRELDMFSPLVWLYREPAAGIDQKWILPFYYSYQSPREDSWAVFPFYGSFKRHSLSHSRWITPLFNYETSITGWNLNLFPLAYFGRDRTSSHRVLAPLLFDFDDPTERTTVVFPVFWRFARPDSLTQLMGNVLYRERKTTRKDNWSVHVLPAFGFGETRRGHWWDILFGLVGYERDGRKTEAKLFWIPIPLSDE